MELRTPNPPRLCAFYVWLFGWHAETVHVGSATYLTLSTRSEIDVGVVEADSALPSWLPYVEVADIHETTERARLLGAAVSLEPREGPAGWRSVLAPPAGAEIGLWQPKNPR